MNSVLGGGLSFLSLPIVSRALGPADYGLFNFLRFSFEKIFQFFALGSSAFYPKISMRPGDRGIIYFMILYEGALILASLFVVIGLIISGRVEDVLSTSSVVIILLTFSFVWFYIINGQMTELMDALGRTITNETVQIGIRFSLTCGFIVLYFFDRLNLKGYLIVQNVVFVISLAFLFSLGRKYLPAEKNSKRIKEIADEFKNYSQPLFIASLIGIIVGIGDRWFLQAFSGSVQQGYYSFGLNLGTICFLLTGSVTPLLTREYAIAHLAKDKIKIGELFSKFIPIFYLLTATISCFLATHGDWVSFILGGSDFRNAAIPVMLLSLAPIHQTYGQLSGGLMVATERTKVYGVINIFVGLLGLPVTYLCIAPNNYFGLDLGASGLAIKALLMQILTVNLQIWFNTKYLGLKMRRFVIQQILIVVLLISIGFTVKSLISYSLTPGIIATLFSGCLYVSSIMALVFIFPELLSSTRKEISDFIRTRLSFLRKLS